MNHKQRKIIKKKYLGHCAYCGISLTEKWHIDHLNPVVRERSGKMHHSENHAIENMMPSCPQCNIHKHSLSLENWRKILEDLPDNLERNSSPFRHAMRFGLVNANNKKIVFYFETFNPAPKEESK